ncbi:MAG: bifunctional heptose 7-phosphate kinase/heptose 1-phosphate adenyltransferase, partial [Anaerolineales bacterium]
VVGSGPEADALLEALALLRVDSGGVLQAPGRFTTVKTRVVAHNQQVVRFDREQDDPLDDQTSARLARRALEVCASADALVVSDYEKGCVTADLLSRVLPAAHGRGIPIVVDPKPGLWRSYSPITAITPNQSEASRMAGMKLRTDQDAAAVGEAIRKSLDCRAVLLTRGELGMLLLEQGQRPLPIPATAREVYDVTGAGDTVAAAMALCLAAGASLTEAALVANAAAGVVVGKVGTATATPEEVSASF